MSIHDAPRGRGATLVELIVLIVVVGVAVAGVLAALTLSTRASADPMIQKQALAIAEAIMDEVQLQPFTYCDPDDSAAATANSTADCSTGPPSGIEAIGKETTSPFGPEDRLDASLPFDNVNDYHNFSMTGMTDIAGHTYTDLTGYSVSVTVGTQGIAAAGGKPAISSGEALLI